MKRKTKVTAALFICFAIAIILVPLVSFAEDEGKVAKDAKKDPSVLHKDGGRKIIKGYPVKSNDTSLKPNLVKKLRAKGIVNDDEDGDFIEWLGSEWFTLYKGENLNVDFLMWDTWKVWYTIPAFEVINFNNDDCVYRWYPLSSYLVVEEDSFDFYQDYFNIGSKKLKPGLYYIGLYAMPCYLSGEWSEDAFDYDIPMETVFFEIKQLPKPSALKLKSGKKKVTVSFKKAKGAKQYEIYRSTKKNSGYKKIATVKGNKYVAKGLKKGKKYYFKVRAKRGNSKTGIAYSAYTAPKRSKKVK